MTGGAAGAEDWRVGDRVEIQPGECSFWGHADCHWAPTGARGTVSGTWTGHPGVEGGHHVAVDFTDRGHFVASLIFREDELRLIRRGRGKRIVDLVPAALAQPSGAAGEA